MVLIGNKDKNGTGHKNKFIPHHISYLGGTKFFRRMGSSEIRTEETVIQHDRIGLSNWDSRVIERHDIFMDDLHGTKKTWLQVMRKKVTLDHTS